MRQGLFVKINEKKWAEFLSSLNDGATSADELMKIYVHLTEDLAYASANYPQTELVDYLNSLTLKVHNRIYRNKPEKASRFAQYWKYEVPAAMRESYRYLLYAFLITAVGTIIGWISAAYDQTFARLILGDDYVNMTLDNIAKGTPMAVYGSYDEGMMFFGITINNIKVALTAFAMGILFSVGTGYILFTNGIMLGVFHYFFFERGFFDDTILTIWVHGTLEISAIIIAGAAGLVMGHGLLFPGTYSRMHSFGVSARKGVKIVLSLVPFFIVAGFIESFITRHTEWPLAVRVMIVSVSAFIVFTYLFILPNYSVYDRSKNSAVQAS